MKIEEAIQHCEEVAAEKTEQGKCPECAAAHKQLVEWLRELVALRAQQQRTLDRSQLNACRMCDSAFTNPELNIDNDLAYFGIGKHGKGYRMLFRSGWGKPVSILAEAWSDRYGWQTIGYYQPRYCPNCGRPLTEEAWAELERRIGGNDGTTD